MKVVAVDLAFASNEYLIWMSFPKTLLTCMVVVVGLIIPIAFYDEAI